MPKFSKLTMAGPTEGARAIDWFSVSTRRVVLWLPLAMVLLLGVVFYTLVGRDPHLVPSALIGRPVPEFDLPPVKGRQLGLSSTDLRGGVSLVNVFASWCVACRAEHPLLMHLSETGRVTIHGIDYKDRPDDGARWLDTMGDPYRRTGADLDGRVALDWGVYGVPETYVIDPAGRIAFKQIGPITPEILNQTILPLVARLQTESRQHAR